MFGRISRAFLSGTIILAGSAAITFTSTVTANALPRGTIELREDFDIYQRPSGTNDSPLGFHVHVDTSETRHIQGDTAILFEGAVHTATLEGDLRDGVIRNGSLSFVIHWDDQKTGIYQGDRYFDGYLRGHTVEQDHSSRTAEWWSGDNGWTATT
ncbi:MULTISPECIES: hypothetical protein [Nocardia]|uniref:hypothetical protein n=1 Tax=Nocardia TaxID=1817 RepID=UPI000D68A5F4|nr:MULTISPECIES: hypothetical protein [Nocardia]